MTEALIQYQHELTGAKEVLSLRLPGSTADKVVGALKSEYPDAKFDAGQDGYSEWSRYR